MTPFLSFRGGPKGRTRNPEPGVTVLAIVALDSGFACCARAPE